MVHKRTQLDHLHASPTLALIPGPKKSKRRAWYHACGKLWTYCISIQPVGIKSGQYR